MATEPWFVHVNICGTWNHEYDAYLNHQASGAKAKEKGVSVDWMFCNCSHERGTAPFGPVPEPNLFNVLEESKAMEDA